MRVRKVWRGCIERFWIFCIENVNLYVEFPGKIIYLEIQLSKTR